MISYLKGTVQYISANSVSVLVHDVGYQVFLGPKTLSEMRAGSEAELHIHQHVKEDALELFGFSSVRELQFFKKLIAISGVGPKSALGILSVATVDQLESAIIRGDASILTKVSGIGKKTAERVVLELKGKLTTLDLSDSHETSASDVEVIEALEGLGYSTDQARHALKEVDQSAEGTDAKLKAALKILAR